MAGRSAIFNTMASEHLFFWRLSYSLQCQRSLSHRRILLVRPSECKSRYDHVLDPPSPPSQTQDPNLASCSPYSQTSQRCGHSRCCSEICQTESVQAL